ncbi:MAG: cation:proton antiporter, partial [Candidatus Diapherotrites archaeon]
ALIPSLFLGSLLCGTDPEATENIIGKYPKKIQEILNAESILNSPFTVILPLIIFDFAVYRSPITFALPLYLAKIVLLCGVGFVIGLIGYFFGKKALQVAGVDLEELTGLAVALIVYVVAENLGGSGIIAVGVTSILLNSSKAPKKPTFTEFNRDIAIILVIFVFVMLGADFPIRMLNIVEITHIDFITVIGFIIAARLITALVISYKSDLNIWERLLIGMNSPKGMAPAALAPLAIVMAERSELMSTQAAYTIIKITYITIILSILLSMLIAHIYATIQKRKERKSEEIKTIEVPKKV